MHEQAFEAERVGGKAQPQHVRVDTRQLVPNDAQVLGALGNLHAHKLLDRFGIAHGMAERADAADTLGNVDELVVVARFHQLFQAAVHETDLWDGLEDRLVFHHEVKMQRLGKHRVLRAERDDRCLSHAYSPAFPSAPAPAARCFSKNAARTRAAFSGSMFFKRSSSTATFSSCSAFAVS